MNWPAKREPRRIGGLTFGEGCAMASLSARTAWVRAAEIRAKPATLFRLLDRGAVDCARDGGTILWRIRSDKV